MESYSLPVVGVIGLLVLFTHPLWYYLALLYMLGIIVYLCLMFTSDGDILLMMYERFGKKPVVFKDKVVWITGASSGIGECLAMALAKNGAKLILTARREQVLNQVKEKCLKGSDLKDEDIMTMTMDAREFDEHEDCVKKALQHFPKIDVLINNSGVSQRAEVHTAQLESDQTVIETNLIGCISVTKHVLHHMVEQKSGHVINISSVAGKLGSPMSTAYSASKFGMIGYFDTFRQEVHHLNISVTNVCPGPVLSHITENAIQDEVDREPVKNYDGSGERALSLLQTGERCAELTLIGAANKLSEIWIGRPPILMILYASQYMPTIYRFISQRQGRRRVEAFRKSQAHSHASHRAYKQGWPLGENKSVRLYAQWLTTVGIATT